MKNKSLNILISFVCSMAILVGIILSPAIASTVPSDTPIIATEVQKFSLSKRMNIENAISPEPSQAQNFFSKLTPGEPFIMVNLLKFKAKAEYEDGTKEFSGAEAYQKYLDEVATLLKKYNVQLLNDLNVVGLLIGKVQDEQLWDRILLIRYPSLDTFQKVTQDPQFKQAQVHRIAGLAGQLNIGTKG